MQDEEEQMQDHVPSHGSNPNAKPSRMATLRQVSRGMILTTCDSEAKPDMVSELTQKLHIPCPDPILLVVLLLLLKLAVLLLSRNQGFTFCHC